MTGPVERGSFDLRSTPPNGGTLRVGPMGGRSGWSFLGGDAGGTSWSALSASRSRRATPDLDDDVVEPGDDVRELGDE